MQKIFLATFFGVFLLISACEKTTPNNNNYLDQADCTGIDANTNTYTNTIKAIMDSNCALSGCHGFGSAEANVDLSTYGKTKTAFENTECLCSIHHGDGCTPMPDGGAKLSNLAIQRIDCWAKNGYKE
ncbi:MAG: hypothetical protein JNJ57_15975 [Saprospiraceae bacterium]|nr:hypothetical protein [Saprospiraceae bacterium]